MLIVKMLVNTGRQKEKKNHMHTFPTVNWTHTHNGWIILRII